MKEWIIFQKEPFGKEYPKLSIMLPRVLKIGFTYKTD